MVAPMRRPFVLADREDPFSGLTVERGKNGEGVGAWVREEKHTYLAKWIEATRLMRKPFRERVLVDLFCGPGRIKVQGEAGTRLGGAQIAWLHSQLDDDAPFTTCVTSDIARDRSDACAQRLRALDAPVAALCGAAVDVVDRAVALVPRGALCLVYLDPYNLEYLSWSVISRLASLKFVDFAVHFSSADLRRNVRMDFEREGKRFDGVAPGWRDKVNVASFFKGEADKEFFDHWCRLVESLGFKISERIPLIRSARNAPLYHLVFFSRHASPVRVWGDVAQGKNRELF